MRWGAPTYVQSPKPTTETSRFHALATTADLVAFRATKADTLPRLSKANSQPAPIGIRIIALATRKACVRANGRASAKLERKLSSTPPKPLPISHTTCALVAPLTREINYCFCVFLRCSLPPPFLVAQGWNVSFIGFAPAHGDAVGPRCVLREIPGLGDRETACRALRSCSRPRWTLCDVFIIYSGTLLSQRRASHARNPQERRTRFVSYQSPVKMS